MIRSQGSLERSFTAPRMMKWKMLTCRLKINSLKYSVYLQREDSMGNSIKFNDYFSVLLDQRLYLATLVDLPSVLEA
jgi:TATA-binding protein-associated factor Taf7